MMEIVFGKTAMRSLQYAGKKEEDIYCFDLALSVGDLIQKEYPDLTELRTKAENGEPLRVWYSQALDEMCGFYRLMSQLEDLEEIELHGIQLPSYYERPDGVIIIWKSWAEVSSEEWIKEGKLEVVSPAKIGESPIRRILRKTT